MSRGPIGVDPSPASAGFMLNRPRNGPRVAGVLLLLLSIGVLCFAEDGGGACFADDVLTPDEPKSF